MSRNWKRSYRLVAGVHGSGFEVGSEMVAGRSVHIKFSLEKTDVTCPNTGTISLWNLNDQHVSILEQKDCMIELHAGYGSTMPLIFSGNVTNPETEMEGADRKTIIDVTDGRVAIRDSYTVLSYQGVIPIRAIVGDCLSQMGITCIYSTQAGVLITSTKMENGYAFAGAASNCLTELCRYSGLQWSIQNGICQITAPGEPITAQAYLLNESTGLIRVPKRIAFAAESTTTNTVTQETTYGYEVEFFMNGAINVNDMVQLQSQKASGFFRVKSIKIAGDNLDGDWTCTAQLVEVKV